MVKRKVVGIRSSKQLKEVIDFIKAKHVLAGRNPPTTADITEKIANKINKEEFLYDDFIKIKL